MVDFDTWQQFAGDMAALPLRYNAPLSEWRATQLVGSLNISDRACLLDLGCGWGELLLHAVARIPGAIAVGVDHDIAAIERARAVAAERHLRRRVTFTCADLITYSGPLADAVFAVGIGHATSSPARTLAIVKDRLSRGGCALYADGYWKRRPTCAEHAAIGNDTRQLGSLDELCSDAVAVGLEVLSVSVADDAELQNYARQTRDGLLQRPGTRDSDYKRGVIKGQESLWHEVLQSLEGFGYLQLRKS